MDKEALTKNESQPEPLSSLKTSSLEEEEEEFARAIRNMKLSPRPSCVPAEVESQSLVSSSSDSHSRKSIGFKADMMRSKSGCRRTNRGILDENQLRIRKVVFQWSRSRIERNKPVEREKKEGEKGVRKTALGPVVVYFEMFGEAAPGFVPATAGALGGRRGGGGQSFTNRRRGASGVSRLPPAILLRLPPPSRDSHTPRGPPDPALNH